MKPLSPRRRTEFLAAALREANEVGTSFELIGGLHATSSGLVVVPVQQHYAGVPVLNGVRTVRFDQEMTLQKITGSVVSVDARSITEPTVSAPDAARALLAHLVAEDLVPHDQSFSAATATVVARNASPARATVLRKEPFDDVVLASLLLDASTRPARLRWELRFAIGGDGYVARVAARARGAAKVVHLKGTASHASHALVYLRDPREERVKVELPMPRSRYPAFSGGSFGSFPWLSGQETSGNNVVCSDAHKKTVQAIVSVEDVGFEPEDALGVEQGVVNTFYLCNFLHDFFLLLGFDESLGNFQVSNARPVGLGGDAIEVTVRDSRQRRWAFYDHRPDGTSPKLSFARHPGGNLSALDAHVVIHEFVHGVLGRVIATEDVPVPLRLEESEALGEGFCDYFALTIVNHYGPEDAEKRWDFASWVTGGKPIREFSYADYPRTYGYLRKRKINVHDAGQVWCAALLKLNAIVGDELGWRIAFDAILLLHPGPVGPTFVHARDAVLDAMARLSVSVPELDAAKRKEVRDAFSALGLGGGAESPDARFKNVVESMDPID